MNRHRQTAIVVSVALKKTRFVTTLGNRIMCYEWGHERFKREFNLTLPHYPLHHAARRYLTGHMMKSPASIEALQEILNGKR